MDHALSLLRNEDSKKAFKARSKADRSRLRLKDNGRTSWRPRGNYRRVRDPAVIKAVQRAIRESPGFCNSYQETVVTHVFQQPKSPYRIVARVEGFGSTFCYNRGPDSFGVPRGPGHHSSSRVFFVLDATNGVRQRCFSEKKGACGECSCRAWRGTPWHEIDDALEHLIWWHRRRDRLKQLDLPGIRIGEEAVHNTERACAMAIHRILFHGIDRGRAHAGLSQVDARQVLLCAKELAAPEAGVRLSAFTPENRADEMIQLLSTHNLDEAPPHPRVPQEEKS